MREYFVLLCSSVIGPMEHLTGLPKTNGTSVLLKRCLNPFLEDGPLVEMIADCTPLWQLAFCPELHVNQISLYSLQWILIMASRFIGGRDAF